LSKLPTCENCGYTWTWKESIRKAFTLNPGMKCPNCEEKQYVTKKSRMRVSLLTPIVLLPLVLNMFFDIHGVVLLSLFPILFVFIMSLHPFLMKLSSKEEYINFFEK